MKVRRIACAAVAALMMAVAAPAGAEEQAGESSDDRATAIRDAVAAEADSKTASGGTSGAAKGGLEPGYSAQAATHFVTDPTGDANPNADLVFFRLSNDGTTVTVTATTNVWTDPATDPNWVVRFSGIAWLLDTTNDFDDDYAVTLVNNGIAVVAAVRHSSGGSVLCTPSVSLSAVLKTYTLSFPASCIGRPSAMRGAAGYVYDTTGVDTTDVTAWSGLVAPPVPAGYWMVGSGGAVYAFCDVRSYGNATGQAVDLEPSPTGKGYWIVGPTGWVTAFGDATNFGSVNVFDLYEGEVVTSISRTPTGKGYWIFTNLGGVFEFGDAEWLGDMIGEQLNGPVLDSVATPSGYGYYMVASDGGVFSFGDAEFYGSMGGKALNAPVMSLVPDNDGVGYWLVAFDGGIFAFNAEFRGSMGSTKLNKPVTGMVRNGTGYLMVAEDGGVFNFSNEPFCGSLAASPPPLPIVSIATA